MDNFMNTIIKYLNGTNVRFLHVAPEYVSNLNVVIEKDIPAGCPYEILNEMPHIDFIFYNAIEGSLVNSKITLNYNIFKAKEIYINHFRKARTPLLAALDVEFMRAVESGNTALQSEIASKKQALRDVTSIDLPDTLEGIKATWPEILGQNPFS